jgi:hypothetical protein
MTVASILQQQQFCHLSGSCQHTPWGNSVRNMHQPGTMQSVQCTANNQPHYDMTTWETRPAVWLEFPRLEYAATFAEWCNNTTAANVTRIKQELHQQQCRYFRQRWNVIQAFMEMNPNTVLNDAGVCCHYGECLTTTQSTQRTFCAAQCLRIDCSAENMQQHSQQPYMLSPDAS